MDTVLWIGCVVEQNKRYESKQDLKNLPKIPGKLHGKISQIRIQRILAFSMCHLKRILRYDILRNVTHRHFTTEFKPVNIQKVKTEFRAYGNGSVDFHQDHENIGIITLNQPDRKNAISGKMMAEFYDIMEHLETRQNIKGNKY